MTFPALVPTLTPESNRHKYPWTDTSRTLRVPLWTKRAEGDVIEGRIRVPVGLCNTPEHSNERLRFVHLIDENLARWVEWRKRRGWVLASKPKVTGPFDPPSQANASMYFERVKQVLGTPGSANPVTQFDSPEEFKVYVVKARFRREAPIYARLEDVMFMNDLAKVYEHDEEPKDTGWIDPMQHAEARRQRLGLRRKDYLFSPIEEPL